MGRDSGIGKIPGALSRVAMAGVMTIVVLAALAPAGKAYLYWTDSGPGATSTGTTLGRANNDGRGLKTTLVKKASAPNGIASHGRYIYWANANTQSIGRAAISGAGASPKFVSPNDNVSSVAVGTTYIYWVGSSKWIGRVKLDGSHVDPTCIDTGNIPGGIFLSGSMIYIGEFQEIDRVTPQCGSTPSTFVTLTTPQSSASPFARFSAAPFCLRMPSSMP